MGDPDDPAVTGKGLVDSLAATVQDGRQVAGAAKQVKRSATTTGKRIGSAVKAAWARMTPAQRKARIAKMHAWRKKGGTGAAKGKRRARRGRPMKATAGFDVGKS
jgi:hypothetical protein